MNFKLMAMPFQVRLARALAVSGSVAVTVATIDGRVPLPVAH